MYWFELGREFKLSLAEIFSFFKDYTIIYLDEKILLLDNLNDFEIKDFTKKAGGTIKIFEIKNIFSKSTKSLEIFDFIRQELEKLVWGKKDFWISFFGESKFDAKRFLLDAKKFLKEQNISSRFVNKDFQNLSSAQIIGENLVEKGSDINIITTKNEIYLTKTLWVQDINAYSKRDFWKKRDMQIGMLPPKLAQMMINIWGAGKKGNIKIYDPFCWLGTILIESLIMGNKEVFWSDKNEEMVQATKENLDFTIKSSFLTSIKYQIQNLDARNIQNSEILKTSKIDAIITEWYLWEIFTIDSIKQEKIEDERKKLFDLYKDFFAWLKKARFAWIIVISFPFWEIKRKYIYFEEIYTLIKSYCHIEKMIGDNHLARETKVWSLLYKRSNQLVGREIFKLMIK